jgi:hypothetical protein
LFHFDLPWNPSRIEQRNGRIDRKLQPAPIVNCRYFFYHQRPEDRVLRALVRKTETIRSQLGSLGQILEGRAAAHLEPGIRRKIVEKQERAIEGVSETSAIAAARAEMEEVEATEKRVGRVRRQIAELQTALERSRRRAGVDPEQVRRALNAGLVLSGGKPLEAVVQRGEDRPDLYALPIDGTALANDTSWLPAIDSLRTRPERDQDPRA